MSVPLLVLSTDHFSAGEKSVICFQRRLEDFKRLYFFRALTLFAADDYEVFHPTTAP